MTWGIRQYQSYNYTKSGNNNPIKVAIIDTGIESSHPDLKGRVLAGYDFVSDDNDPADDQGHGTHVAGTIGASLNGSGIIGVNPRVQFVPLKICNAQGFCPSYGVIRALDWVQTNNIDVVNMSLG